MRKAGSGREYTETPRVPLIQAEFAAVPISSAIWFDKAREAVDNGMTKRAGLVATNSIRGGANRVVLRPDH